MDGRTDRQTDGQDSTLNVTLTPRAGCIKTMWRPGMELSGVGVEHPPTHFMSTDAHF